MTDTQGTIVIALLGMIAGCLLGIALRLVDILHAIQALK